MVFDAILDEALGTLCGLPPGTVTAATAVMGKVASSGESQTKDTVEKKTQGLSKKGKKVLTVATLNLADTAKRDHPRKSKRACDQYAMNIILIANRLYPPKGFKDLLVDAVQPSHKKCRKVMMTVERDFKRAIR
jgi:hypothetical protein